MPNTTANIIPKNTPVPMACRLADPGPEAMTIGNIPRMNASEVMRMGRNRSFEAKSAAS